ncbi:MAG: alpha/beta hydrolase [Bacteroidota bacterium]
MKQIESSLVHHVIPPAIEKSGPPYPTMVLLHGRGTDENDLLGVAHYLDKRLLLVSVRAPHPFAFGEGYTWYEALEVGRPAAKQFTESYDRLSSFLTDIRREYPIDPSRLYLLGFSMGTVMAYAIALTKPEIVSGVVAHSGYVPENSGLKFRLDNLGPLSVFIVHGLHDPVIPVSFAHRAKELLSQTSARLTYREYPIGHSVSEDSIRDSVSWLTERIDGTQR